jgi:hypothetical protein
MADRSQDSPKTSMPENVVEFINPMDRVRDQMKEVFIKQAAATKQGHTDDIVPRGT